MANQRDQALAQFSGAYGHLCVGIIQALQSDQYSREAVRIAGQGRGINIHLGWLRDRHTASLAAMHRAQIAGWGRSAIIGRAEQVRHAIESEWECKVPIVQSTQGRG